MTSSEKSFLNSLAQDESKSMKWMMSKGKAQPAEECEKIERHLREQLVYLNTCKLSRKIPRQIMCLDEKYLRHCLEMIHISAGMISLHTNSVKTGISLEGFLFPLTEDKYSSRSADCFDKRSLPTGLENVNFTFPGHWVIGSINESKSMKNLMKHPMLHRVEVPEVDQDDSDFEFPNSGSHAIICSPQKLNNFYAISSIDVSEEPMPDLGAVVSHGMLQCTPTDDPHYVFSVDENREVYEASVLSIGSSSNRSMQWMGSFSLQNGRRKEGHGASNKDSSHVGTMKMSAHLTTCPNNFEILEMECVMYGFDEKTKDESESDPLSQSFQTKKGFSKKVVSTFKPSLSVMKRTKSSFWRSSSITYSCPWSPPTEVQKSFEKQVQLYSEIASIIIRKHVTIPPKEVVVAEPGGWGASILKRVDHKEGFISQDHTLTSKCHQQCCDENCSTTNIIIPAGYHSRPETGDGVPSSLIERWKSDGQCDCGGWDIGCPLTVFTTRPNRNAALGPHSNQWECTSFDIVLKGNERHPPQMKMVNIGGDLYYLHFQSSLSALQCFAIAVAVLHCKNDMLQTKMVQELENRSVEVTKDVEFCKGRV